MALVNRSFSVNITPGMMPPIVHVSEYDVGRAYTVSILDEQGNTFTIPSGTTASIEGTLNGSVGFTKSATVSNNQVSFTLSQDMTAYSGKAWCKIKLTQNSQPIQTCAFVLAVDRAGVEADTIIGAPGFQEQINEGIAEYFDNDPPFFELPRGGRNGQALLSDGQGGAVWGTIQSGGSGLTSAAKAALLACFQNVAWANENGQTLYSALESALNSQPAPDDPVTPDEPVVPGESQMLQISGLTVVDGYIDDNGQVASKANAKFVDVFYPVCGFFFALNGQLMSQTIRYACYDSNKQFLGRTYESASVIVPTIANTAYVKVGWEGTTPDTLYLAKILDTSIFTVDGYLDANGEITQSSSSSDKQDTTDYLDIPNNATSFALAPLGGIVRLTFHNSSKQMIARYYNGTTASGTTFAGTIPSSAKYYRMTRLRSNTNPPLDMVF